MGTEFSEGSAVFWPLFWLFAKHFVCDFPLQAFSWLYLNKGKYLHPGGITHAAIHSAGTMLVLSPFLGLAAWKFALVDLLVHYHIDWAKMNLTRKHDLKPDNSEWFWILLGLDQWLHGLTYFAIIYYAFII